MLPVTSMIVLLCSNQADEYCLFANEKQAVIKESLHIATVVTARLSMMSLKEPLFYKNALLIPAGVSFSYFYCSVWVKAIFYSTAMTSVMKRLPFQGCSYHLFHPSCLSPSQTPTSITLSCILMDTSIYHNLYDYRPKRWLGTPAEQAHLAKYFIPFGQSMRMCVGMK